MKKLIIFSAVILVVGYTYHILFTQGKKLAMKYDRSHLEK